MGIYTKHKLGEGCASSSPARTPAACGIMKMSWCHLRLIPCYCCANDFIQLKSNVLFLLADGVRYAETAIEASGKF